MAEVSLQEIINDIRFDDLPLNWTSFDLQTFSNTKQLWDYQQEAVENAIKVLWKYYQDFQDYQPNEAIETNSLREQKLFQWYQDNGLETNLDISLSGNFERLLEDYYEVTDSKVSYQQFINRMSFWMATGSGKTLVLVKLIEILRTLVQQQEIPPYDMLVLTHRDDLIGQLKTHVDEFNLAHRDFVINLRELKEYAVAKRENPSLFKDRQLTVFFYRSDNLSDEQKEKIIDFKSYDDQGRWYVFLDEAHKGDKEDSKRQHIYSILSRNGFLFNFSATFIDQRDIITTACNFNLSEFIRAGYGKHIAILQQEIRAFRVEEDYNNDEKQKIVLKSLIMLAYANKFLQDIRQVQKELYHKPLLLTLVNSVNTEDADLKLFFRELERIGKGQIGDDIWQAAKDELWQELKERPDFMFEEGNTTKIEKSTFKSLTQKDILASIYNSHSTGDIEVLVRPSNKKELALKLKTSDRPFALIKIGDVSGWLKDELAGYEINERFEDEGYFERLNEDDSDINILMGSRSFYEGWDSNRPNVMNFINIGIGIDAKKFILQAVGRGVRIEPVKNKRKRLVSLYNAKEIEANLFQQVKEYVESVETLFIFGTNRNALRTVISHLDTEQKKQAKQLELFVNEQAKRRKLLIPTYKQADQPLVEQREQANFEIAQNELGLLQRYVDFIDDDRVLLAKYETEPKKIDILKKSLSNPADYYKENGRSFKNIDLLVSQVFNYFSIVPQEFEELKDLQDEIRHFKNIRVSLEDISELKQKIEKVHQYKDPSVLEKQLKKKHKQGKITLDEYTEQIKVIAQTVDEEFYEHNNKRIKIKHIPNHYFTPLILSEEEKIDYIKHIIKTPSEVKFISDLETYLSGNNGFKNFDWWLFSKLDESLDQVYIPYYNPDRNDISKFKPDFIFWLQKGSDYYIVFIDPKSTKYTDYEHKIDGYKIIFEENDSSKKDFPHKDLKVKVFVFLRADNRNNVSEGYREFWFDKIETVLEKVLNRSASGC